CRQRRAARFSRAGVRAISAAGGFGGRCLALDPRWPPRARSVWWACRRRARLWTSWLDARAGRASTAPEFPEQRRAARGALARGTATDRLLGPELQQRVLRQQRRRSQ